LEETLERGLLFLEDSAHSIKELRQEREALLKRKVDLQKKWRSAVGVLPITTELMAQYFPRHAGTLTRKEDRLSKGIPTRDFEGGQNQRYHVTLR
jgi:hypothetical protein